MLGLGLIAVSGLMMLTSDLESFLASRTYWIKMSLVLVLVANGYAITRIQATLRPDAPHGWTALGHHVPPELRPLVRHRPGGHHTRSGGLTRGRPSDAS